MVRPKKDSVRIGVNLKAPSCSTVTDLKRNEVLVLKRIIQNKPNEIIISFNLSINKIILRKKRGPKFD